MKKITLLLLLTLSVLGLQAQTYQLNYDSIRVGKTAGTGGTSLYGKVYLKNTTTGLSSDSILVYRGGRIYRVANTAPSVALSATSPIFYNSGTGVISSQAASNTQAGYVDTLAQTYKGLKTFSSIITIPDETYDAAWNGKLQPPTKNAIWNALNSSYVPYTGASTNVNLGTNSLLSTGSIASTGNRILKGWFTDLESTNMPTVGGTSLSSTFAGIGQTMHIGTTAVAINRASATLNLAGIGTLGVSGDVTNSASVANFIANSSTDGKSTFRLQTDGTLSGLYGESGSVLGTSDRNPALYSETGYGLNVYVNGLTTTALSIASTGAATFSGNISAANLTSGTYTPTLTNGTNVGSPTIYNGHYIRVGNQVTVSGYVRITTSAAGDSSFELSLPIASDFTNSDNDVAGTVTLDDTGVTSDFIARYSYVIANTTNNTLQFGIAETPNANSTGVRFSCTYTIL